MHLAALLAIALSASASTSTTAPAPAPSCRIDAFGIFPKAESVGTRVAPNTPTGRVRVYANQVMEVKTSTIPARLGLRFGVAHTFLNIPEGDKIDMTMRHPPLQKKGGGTSTESRTTKEPNSQGSAFGFDSPQEVVLGKWVFEFRHKGKLLCSQPFQVVADK